MEILKELLPFQHQPILDQEDSSTVLSIYKNKMAEIKAEDQGKIKVVK